MALNKETGETKKKRRNILIVIGLFCFLIYGNSIKNKYAIDDNFVTSTGTHAVHPRVEKGIKGIPEIFTSHYIESRQQSFEYRPLVLTTFAIEYQFFGSNPTVSHFINVSIYAFTCMLLFLILCRQFSNYHFALPLLITLLFIAHPIHSEVVNNLKSRDELLSFFFGLCALHFFVKNVHLYKWNYFLAGTLFLLAGLLCKTSAVLFAVLIPFAIFFTHPLKKKEILYSILPFLVYIFYNVLKGILLPDSTEMRENAFFENPLFYSDFYSRIPMAFYSAGSYIKLLLLPHPLSCYYGFNVIPLASWSHLVIWISLVFHLFIGIYALLNFRKKNTIAYGILIYLIGIFPFVNLITPVVGIVAERFIYFASLGFCISLAGIIFIVSKIDPDKPVKLTGLPAAFKVICFILLSLYSVKVISRNSDWYDELTLFRKDVKNFENSCNLNYITANALARKIPETVQGQRKNQLITEAVFHYKKTAELMSEGIKLYPEDYTTMNNLGTIHVDVFNNPDMAQPLFRKVISMKPDNDEGQYNYGFCYEKRNLPDSAIAWYENLIAKGSNYLPVYLRLHKLYYETKQYDKAIVNNKKALAIHPEKIELYINLGNSHMMAGDTLNGLRYFEEAAAKPPLDYVLLQNVSDVLKITGDTARALEYQSRANAVKREMQNKKKK